MTKPEELAERLISADDDERRVLFKRHADLLDTRLARSLKSVFDDSKHSDPARAERAVAALNRLSHSTHNPEIDAIAHWTSGVRALLIDGQAERAINELDEAAARFIAINQPRGAAATQVSKLHALAILGRYDEALECGLRARDVFVTHRDEAAAGKIEHNLGNIYFRRDAYQQAEAFYRAARARFADLGDERQLTFVETSLATALIFQHKFRDAAALYEQALARAEAAGLVVAQAVIECDLGCLALFQGRYDQALDFLERSRRRYAALGMTHESAIAEQELADAYLELNLVPEAAAIYSQVTPTFAALGMRAERARALASHGRAALLMGRTGEGRALLAEAETLYAEEGNPVGEATVALAEAQLYHSTGDDEDAARLAARAERPFTEAHTWERALLARWLRAEALRAQGRARKARALFDLTLGEADRHALPQIIQRCHTSLGLLAASAGDVERAEASFKRAVEVIEDLRALLPSDEFRTAFVGDKLTPYTELVRLCLAGSDERIADALGYVERARSRALSDMLSGAVRVHVKPRDQYEADLLARLEELREELNWFYSQINRPPEADAPRSPAIITALHADVREREGRLLELMRQLQQRGDGLITRVEPPDINQLQRRLGGDTALVEYFSLDGRLIAFVVTAERVEVIRHLAHEDEVAAALDRLRFQINSLRHGAARMQGHLDQLTRRTRHYLGALYDLLLGEVEARIGARRLVVVPHRALHYVPFHALYDGEGYAIERREFCYAPSAGVLSHCLNLPARPIKRALLLGVPDEQAPRVRDEVVALEPLFDEAAALLGGEATIAALKRRAADADVLHLACHGQFRADNPLFSSLKLADGWLTVRDAYGLDLRGGLVALSACETGVSAVAPGDEIIGLARGFFSAGAPSLLLTLWTVDDEATADLMTIFYRRLLAGDGPAAALRRAQCDLLARKPHPFFWSPFIVLGRW
jgi:CHAT domain-containing protein/tetratricopeptide (TPR) repeat protein